MICHLLFIGTTELLLIGGIALLLFGGKKLPEMMRGLGQGVKEFKKGVNEVDNVIKEKSAENEETTEEEKQEGDNAQQMSMKTETKDGGQQ